MQGEPCRVDHITALIELEKSRTQAEYRRCSHLAHDPAMIRRQWRIVQSPPFQIVKIPLRGRQVAGDLDPVSLCLEVAVHGRFLEPYG